MAGIGLAVVPYMVGKSLSEMVAIRQRHLMLEQSGLQQRMMMEAMEQAAREYEAQNTGAPAAPASAPQPAPAAVSSIPPVPPAPHNPTS